MKKASVDVREYSINEISVVPFIPNLTDSQVAYKNPNEVARPSVPDATPPFWTMYVLSAYEYRFEDHDNHSFGGGNVNNVREDNGFYCKFCCGINLGNAYVFSETIRDIIHTHDECSGIVTNATEPLADYETYFARLVAHEVLHSFLGIHVNPNNPLSTSIADQGIMNYSYMYQNWDCDLSPSQIQTIQAKEMPTPSGS